MDLYIAICEDRHADVHVMVFNTPEKAIEYAKEFAQNNARHPEEIKESKIEGWIYNCSYSCESDSVRVEKSTLNNT